MGIYRGIDWTSDKDLKRAVGGLAHDDEPAYGWLRLSETGERMRAASVAEALASADAAEFDEGEGLIVAAVDGREEVCYVE